MIDIGTFLRSSRVGQALQPVHHVDSPPWASLEARDAVPDPAAVVRSCLPYAGSGGNSARSRGHTLPDSEGRTPWPVEAVYVAGMKPKAPLQFLRWQP